MFWRSMEELLPIFEREGIGLRLEPHPDDFVEDGKAAVDMVRGINSPAVTFLYCAPHTFHRAATWRGIMRHAGDLLTHVHVADSLRPPRLVGPALHPQPAGHDRPDPPAPRHRPGRGRLGRVLRDPRRAALRRHHDRVRVRVGGTGPGVEPRTTSRRSGAGRRRGPISADPATPAVTGVAPEAIAPVASPVDEVEQPIAEVHSHRSALILLALLAVIWGVHWVIVKVGLGYVPPITYAASRVAIAPRADDRVPARPGPAAAARTARTSRSSCRSASSRSRPASCSRTSPSRSSTPGARRCSCTRCRCGSR